MDKNGNIPNIGDQDSAVLVNFGLDNWENFRSVLNTGAVLFHRPEFSLEPDIKTYLLLGAANGENLQELSTNITKNKGKLFPHAGLVVIRDIVSGMDNHLIGNLTPLGAPPLYAHGHLDVLSFTLSIDGDEFFIDPGTYLYHSGGKWRRYFRSAAAHNTLRVNGVDFTEQPGDFMFGEPYEINESVLEENEKEVIWRAGHNAYRRLKPPVSQSREIIYKKYAGVFRLYDTLFSQEKFFSEQFFHFHPACHVKIDGQEVIIKRNGITVSMVIDSRLKVKIYKGSTDPILGWYSKKFNDLKETTTLVCSEWLEGDAKLTTLLTIHDKN